MFARKFSAFASIRAGSTASAATRFIMSARFKSGTPTAVLQLKNGPTINGRSFGANVPVTGEVVFTTSLVGYPESMTDPSYRGQILVFTQPLVGNYGVPGKEKDIHGLLKHFESDRIHVAGIIVQDYSGDANGQQARDDPRATFSHWNAVQSLGEWCRSEGIPAIEGVDTRALTKLLRQNGSTLGRIVPTDSESAAATASADIEDPNKRSLAQEVSVKQPITFNRRRGAPKVAVVDCGVKYNILRSLISRGVEVELLPFDFDFTKPGYHYDGLFVSNGPGDPRTCGPVVDHLRSAMALYPDRPIFGICMGNLLMGMASGLGIRKLRYGNRGHNQPAVNHLDGRCYITSQNHGYAVIDNVDPVGRDAGVVMPPGWARLFSNANDGSNEGLYHATLPFSSVQFHPEARGGPQDTDYLFDAFVAEVVEYKALRENSALAADAAALINLKSKRFAVDYQQQRPPAMAHA